MVVTLRNYQAEDYPQVRSNLEIAGLFWESMDSELLLSRMIARDPESIIVAEDNGHVAGSAYFIDMGFAAMSWRLNVIFEYRKKGVAKQLIDEAKMRAKKRGFTQIQFVVHEEQERLRKWYQQQGAWSESLYRWMVFDL